MSFRILFHPPKLVLTLNEGINSKNLNTMSPERSNANSWS